MCSVFSGFSEGIEEINADMKKADQAALGGGEEETKYVKDA